MVERLFLRNKKTGEDFHIPVSGVFVAIGQIPQNEIFDGLYAWMKMDLFWHLRTV